QRGIAQADDDSFFHFRGLDEKFFHRGPDVVFDCVERARFAIAVAHAAAVEAHHGHPELCQQPRQQGELAVAADPVLLAVGQQQHAALGRALGNVDHADQAAAVAKEAQCALVDVHGWPSNTLLVASSSAGHSITWSVQDSGPSTGWNWTLTPSAAHSAARRATLAASRA